MFIQFYYLFQTPFVRQNTPHPKELKAKAHKLFSKGGQNSSLEESDLQQQQQSKLEEQHPSQLQEQLPQIVTEAVNKNVREVLIETSNSTPYIDDKTGGIGNGQEEISEDDDADYVSTYASSCSSLRILQKIYIR